MNEPNASKKCPERWNFDHLFTEELSYHGLPVNGTIRSKHDSLNSALEAEAFYDLITKLVQPN
jgi:hypothetical protein